MKNCDFISALVDLFKSEKTIAEDEFTFLVDVANPGFLVIQEKADLPGIELSINVDESELATLKGFVHVPNGVKPESVKDLGYLIQALPANVNFNSDSDHLRVDSKLDLKEEYEKSLRDILTCWIHLYIARSTLVVYAKGARKEQIISVPGTYKLCSGLLKHITGGVTIYPKEGYSKSSILITGEAYENFEFRNQTITHNNPVHAVFEDGGYMMISAPVRIVEDCQPNQYDEDVDDLDF